MSQSQKYTKLMVLTARASIVVTGAVLIGVGFYAESFSWAVIRYLGYALEVLGAIILGFGAFARGNTCADIFYRVLYYIAN